MLRTLEHPRFARLLGAIQRAETPRARLEVGHRVRLDTAQQALAVELNTLYSRLVWGLEDDADNRSVRRDERRVLTPLLHRTVWGTHVLEVGCGSGRLTRYLAGRCERLVAIDREPEIISRARLNLEGLAGVECLHLDFARLAPRPAYSAVLLMENLLGMVPCDRARARLFRQAFEVLMPGGLALFAFRVMRQRAPLAFQAMPYRMNVPRLGELHLFGIATTWTVAGFQRALARAAPGFTVLDVIPGDERPAGGRMFTAVAHKPWPRSPHSRHVSEVSHPWTAPRPSSG